MPKHRVIRPRRSLTEWGVRGALAITAAGLGYVSVSHSLAYMIRASAPARAHALASWDGRITALLSEQLSGPDATPADRKRADELARLALRQDPTTVPAVATLGINAQVRGDTTAARRIFAYSERLSRRDLRTRLWAIEDAVDRGDIPGALRNYDIALRTSRIAAGLLFPVLASAISDPDIRQALVSRLVQRPIWSDQFLASIAATGPEVRATAILFEALQRRGITLPSGAASALVSRLLAENHVGDAWRFYATLTPGADRRVARDPNFTANLTSPTPFDWVPVIDSGVSATLQRGERGGIFDFSVPPNLGGPILRQTQLLPPGNYEIKGSSIGIEQADDALPYWTLTCPNGRELGRVIVPNSAQANGRFAGRFTVPAGCMVQQLVLVARSSEQLSGLTGQISEIRLQPVKR
ncbi:hypothetical protein [Sphingomonas hankookensis]